MKEYGDIVIDDPRALRALAHPTRLAILERLQGEGPATATEVGGTVGVSPSAASYHLRALARFGLVVETRDGRGRNRPWRAVGTGFRFEPARQTGTAAQAAAQLLTTQLVARGEDETLEFVAHRPTLPAEWRDTVYISNATLCVSAEEAKEVVRQLEALLGPYYRSSRRNAPEGAAVMRLLIRLFPRQVPEQ